jgi:nucleotide-binding universal stress UspA family protein
VTADFLHVPDRYAGVAIVDTASRVNCDLIVMGSHGRRGIDRLVLGSQAYEVISHCKLPTLVVR